MLHGMPYCKACGYEGPNFMWMPHHGTSHFALVQHRDTLRLRLVEIPEFNPPRNLPPDEQNAQYTAHVWSAVEQHLTPQERHVCPTEFAWRPDGDKITDLPCPRCRQLLHWRHTGIS